MRQVAETGAAPAEQGRVSAAQSNGVPLELEYVMAEARAASSDTALCASKRRAY
jgi:hypothetical protein